MVKIQKTLGELAELIDAEVVGDPDCVINSVATLQNAMEGQLTFLDNPMYRKFLSDSKASVVILAAHDVDNCPTNALVVRDPYFAYAQIASLFVQQKNRQKKAIHPSAVIGEDCEIDPSVLIAANVVIEDHVKIGANSVIGAGSVVGNHCQIGEGCHIEANVTLYYGTQLANRVIVHSGAVLGSDGFGFAEKDGAWHKVPQLGRVVLHSDVEVGANTTIDRGALEDTVIKKGVKLDNQIQIAHNVVIGEHAIVAACTGISGSTRIGKHCRIAGGVGIVGHVELADYSVITGMSLVSRSVKTPGIYSSGTGLTSNQEWKKNVARFKQLDKVLRRLLRDKQAPAVSPKMLPKYDAFSARKVEVMQDEFMSINEIFKYVPHRPPFLLIDRIIEYKPEKGLTAIKNVTINEAYFGGHFPARPIMPGVLILEAMAQASTVFAFLTTGEDPNSGEIYYFAGIDRARFKRPVEPGDQLTLEVEFLKARRGVWKMKGIAKVAGEIVCSAELLSAKPEKKEEA